MWQGLYAGLQVIDVTNPTNCTLVGGYTGSGAAVRVAISGNYAYIANDTAGLQVIDVGNPTNCVLVGGYKPSNGQVFGVAVSENRAYVSSGGALTVVDVSDPANCVQLGVTVSGNYAYLADDNGGLQVIDVSNPSNCVRVASFNTGGQALGVAVVADRIYIADGDAGLLNLLTLPNVQFTVRVDATPGVPFTLEAATHLSDPNSWQPLLTTNVATMPFDFVDFDVKLADKPQKFYRVRQP